METADAGAPVGDPGTASSTSTPLSPTPPRRRPLAVDLTIIGVIIALVLVAAGSAVGVLYRELYSPTAFVQRYLSLLADGKAADALVFPGVNVDSTALAAAGLPEIASDALLRTDILTHLTDIAPVSEVVDGEVTAVTVSYKIGGQPGETTYLVESAGWIGVVPEWRFAESPLASLTVVTNGSRTFEVNGFSLDTRQISPSGLDASPLEPVTMLVFSPGLYRVGVDTQLASTPGVDVLANAPMKDVPLKLQAEAKPEFIDVVEEKVNAFLDSCAEQELLFPTGCPFGRPVQNRINNLPQWSITEYPDITLAPAGADWFMAPAEAVAHLEVEIKRISNGTLVPISEDVPFTVAAQITVRPDGAVSILVEGGGEVG